MGEEEQKAEEDWRGQGGGGAEKKSQKKISNFPAFQEGLLEQTWVRAKAAPITVT